MKSRTFFINGNNPYYVYFCYEDYFGNKYGNYKDYAWTNHTKNGMLRGYLHSDYWGCTECIDEMEFNGKPSRKKVKEFIKGCFDVLDNKTQISRNEYYGKK